MTLLEYVDHVANVLPNAEAPRKLMSSDRSSEIDWDAHIIHWLCASPIERLLVIKFLGDATERHAVSDLLQAKPPDVSWQSLINAVFERDLRVAPTKAMDIRNRREPREQGARP